MLLVLYKFAVHNPSFPAMDSVSCTSSYGNKELGSLTNMEEITPISDSEMYLGDDLGDFKSAVMSQTPSNE